MRRPSESWPSGRDEEVDLRLDIPSRVETLELVADLVEELAVRAGFDPESALDIRIAVHEAVINAIVHGNHADATRQVHLDIRTDAEGLEVRVRDHGRGFEPGQVPDPLALPNLSKSSGRGLLLMRTLMDEVHVGRAATGGAEVRLVKSRRRRRRDAASCPDRAGAERRGTWESRMS